MSNFLLIDTATDVCSVAVSTNGSVSAMRETSGAMQHAAILTKQIEAVVNEAGLSMSDLDAVAISKGPGSYTGLRVGASVAKGLCFALDIPLIGVDTLWSLAWAAREKYGIQPALFVPMLDARRQEVWTAVYDHHLNSLAPAQPLVLDAPAVLEQFLQPFVTDKNTTVVFSGNGSFKIKDAEVSMPVIISSQVLTSSIFLEKNVFEKWASKTFEDVAYFEPFYMKPPNITKPNSKL